MKKVLYVTTVSRTINAFLVPHIEMLIDKGYKVDCACFIDREIDETLLGKGVNIFDIPFNRNPLSIGNLKAFKKLVEIQECNKYDVVHVHTPIASIYGRLLKLKFKELKTIYTAHGYHFFKGSSKLSWLIYYPIEKAMAKLTDITININKEDFEITKNKLKPKKSYLMNGVGLDLSKYKSLSKDMILKKKEELGLNEDDFIIIMIAELNKNKNQIQLIKAMELLKDKYPNIKVISVGEGNKLEELQNEVNKRDLEENIMFLGFRNDVNELINIADIGVLFSYREGLPRNLMELMANGKKIVATNIRGNRDIVSSEFLGSLVKVGDFEETANVIEDIYLNRTRNNDKEKIIAVAKRYDISNILEILSYLYESLEEGGVYNEKMSSYITDE